MLTSAEQAYEAISRLADQPGARSPEDVLREMGIDPDTFPQVGKLDLIDTFDTVFGHHPGDRDYMAVPFLDLVAIVAAQQLMFFVYGYQLGRGEVKLGA